MMEITAHLCMLDTMNAGHHAKPCTLQSKSQNHSSKPQQTLKLTAPSVSGTTAAIEIAVR